MPRLAALVVTYNRLDLLKRTVERFLESPPNELDLLLVVDNASSDGTSAWLAAKHNARLRVLRLERNEGGAGGFAAGMALIRDEVDPDWLLVTDDDGMPERGALHAFHALDRSGWDALAAAVYTPSGEICEMNRPSQSPFKGVRAMLRALRGGRDGFHVSPVAYRDNAPVQVDIASFVGLFIRRGLLSATPLPDPGLFIYGDDGLYTYAITQAGGRIGFVPTVRFIHDLSTFEGRDGGFHPLWKLYYYHRNLLLLYRAVAGPWFWAVLLVILPKWGLKHRNHVGARRLFARLMCHAIIDGLCRRTDIEHSRILAWATLRR